MPHDEIPYEVVEQDDLLTGSSQVPFVLFKLIDLRMYFGQRQLTRNARRPKITKKAAAAVLHRIHFLSEIMMSSSSSRKWQFFRHAGLNGLNP